MTKPVSSYPTGHPTARLLSYNCVLARWRGCHTSDAVLVCLGEQSCTINSIYHEMPLTRLAIATFSVAKDLCLTAIPSLAESRGGELVATVTILMVIATLAVILRLYARKISGTKLGTDDYMIVVALVCFPRLQRILHFIDEVQILTYGLDVNSYFGTVPVITLVVLCS